MSFAPGFRTGPFLGPARKPPPPTPSAYTTTTIYLAGGDTADPTTLIHGGIITCQWQVNAAGVLGIVGNPQYGNTVGQFQSVGAALTAACLAAGAGKAVVGFSNPPFYQQMTIIFDASVSPRVWYCDNVGQQPQVWQPATGLPAGNGLDMAQAPFAEGAVAVFVGPASRYSSTGVPFGTPGTPPSQINHVILEPGQAGIYLGAANGGIVKSIDFGATWGYVRPHAGLGTAWPVGAVGRDVCILPAARPQPALASLIVLGTNVYKKLGDDNVWVAIDGLPPTLVGQQLMYFGNGNLLHMSQREGSVRYSADSGDTWATRSIPAPAEDLDSFSLAGDGRLWALGKKVTGSPDVGYVFYSDNFGVLWNLSTSWTIILDVCQISANPVNSSQIAASFLSGGDVGVRVTQNRGASWTNRTVDATSTFIPSGASGRILWIGSRMVIIYNLTSGNLRIKYSDDFGANWTTAVTIALGASGTHIFDFINGTALGPMFAVISKLSTSVTGCMLRSLNHGATWDQLDSPFGGGVTLRSLAYDALTDTLFVEGSDGNIKYLTGASTKSSGDWAIGFITLTAPGITVPNQGSTMVLAVN